MSPCDTHKACELPFTHRDGKHCFPAVHPLPARGERVASVASRVRGFDRNFRNEP